jgi:hypothetical protein
MIDDNSLFQRMLANRHSYSLGGPIGEAAQQIAQIKQQQAMQKPEDLPLTEFDKDFLHELKVKV